MQTKALRVLAAVLPGCGQARAHHSAAEFDRTNQFNKRMRDPAGGRGAAAH